MGADRGGVVAWSYINQGGEFIDRPNVIRPTMRIAPIRQTSSPVADFRIHTRPGKKSGNGPF